MKKIVVFAIIISFVLTGFAAVSATATPAEAEEVTYQPGYSNTAVTVVVTSGPRIDG